MLVLCSTLAFYRFGWWTLTVLVPLALLPFVRAELAGDLSVYVAPLVFGITGGYCFRKGLGLDFYLTVSAIAFTVLFTADYLALKNFKGYDMVKISLDEMVLTLENSKQGIDQLGAQYHTPKEEIDKIKSDLNAFIATMQDRKWVQMARDLIPFSAFLLAAAIAGTSFLLMMKVTMKKVSADVKALQYFRVHDFFIFALIAGIAGLLLLKQESNPVLYTVSLNIALITAMLYTIQALGIVKFFFMAKGIPVFIIPLLLLIFTVISPGSIVFITIFFTGFGSLDLWADFRKLGSNIMNNKE